MDLNLINLTEKLPLMLDQVTAGVTEEAKTEFTTSILGWYDKRDQYQFTARTIGAEAWNREYVNIEGAARLSHLAERLFPALAPTYL